MSTKLCAPCRRAFDTIEQYPSGYWISPFHKTPWNVFEGPPDISQDIMKSVSKCDFCSFLIAFAAFDKALGGYGYGCHSCFAPEGFRSRIEPVLGVSKSSMFNEGMTELGLWRRRDDFVGANQAIRVFEATDSRMKGYKPIHRTSTSTSGQDSFDCLTNWINTCSRNHLSCQKLHTRSVKDKDWLPARLVKIILNADGTPESIQVIETGKDDYTSANTQYATLSYCWGTKPFLKLLKSNFGSITTSGLLVQDLPDTFRDAITATVRLGLKYIWIDALCIVQLDAEDWSVQSVTMARVYTYSAITLAAAASSDVHGGLFRDRNPTAINGLRVDVNWPGIGLEGEHLLVPSDPWAKFAANSPLMERAWVFQERLLSRGTVYFAHDMLYWECGELYASELYPKGGPWGLQNQHRQFNVSDRLPLGVLPSWDYRFKHVYTNILTRAHTQNGTMTDEEIFLFVWASIVTQYSVGNLTQETDKLVAIDGVAQQMTSIVPRENYLHGIWRQENFPLFLLWSNSTYSTPKARPNTRVAPSWSWASVHTPISFSFLFTAQNEPKLVTEVLDVISPNEPKLERADMPPFAALVVRGPLTEVHFRSFSRSSLGSLRIYWQEPDSFKDFVKCANPFSSSQPLVFKGKGLKSGSVLNDVTLDWKVPKKRRFFALKVAEADIRFGLETNESCECGLLLMPCTDETQERGTFVRVGYFCITGVLMHRDWRHLPSSVKSKSKLKKGLWNDSRIEEKFYREKDDNDGYTIRIV